MPRLGRLAHLATPDPAILYLTEEIGLDTTLETGAGAALGDVDLGIVPTVDEIGLGMLQ